MCDGSPPGMLCMYLRCPVRSASHKGTLYCATGGVGLDTDGDLDRASQPMSRATSGDVMVEDEDMPSGLLASWLLI